MTGRRRQEYAQQTQLAILSAARKLFAEQGYGPTRVEEIAKLARVAPVTVYSASGGKSGLLRSLMDIWSAAPIIGKSLHSIQALRDPVAVLELVASVVRSMREEFADIIHVLLDAAPHDQAVAESLEIATARYRQSFVTVAQHLAALHALKQHVSTEEAAETLWFYFGYWGFYTLHIENGWTYDKAEKWLFSASRQALLSL